MARRGTPRRPRAVPHGTDATAWSTRNLPVRLLHEMRVLAALTDILPAPRSVEAIANAALELGLPAIRRAIERQLAALPPTEAP